MDKKSGKYKNSVTHFFVWFIYIFINLSAVFVEDEDSFNLIYLGKYLNIISSYLFFASFFYLNIFFLNKFNIKAFWQYLILFFGLYAYYLLLYVVKFEIVLKYFINWPPDESYRVLIPDTFAYYCEYIAISYGYWYFKSSAQKEKELRISAQQLSINEQEKLTLQNNNLLLKEQNTQLEKENIQYQMDYLRAQINPHFLFNTINVMYAKILPINRQAANGLMDLSEVMRYSINDKYDADGKVTADVEDEQLEHLINLHQLRFDNKLHIQYNKSGDLTKFRIVPLVLVTILENAFKHGNLSNPADPLLVTMDASNGHLIFTTKNRIGPPVKSNNRGGLGMENIAKRLDFAHKNKFEFNFYKKENHYFVLLKIEE